MHCVDVLLIEPVRLCASGLRHLLLGSRYMVAEEVHAAASPLVLANGTPPQLVVLGPGASALTEGGRAWVRQQRGTPGRSRVVAFVDTSDAPLVRRLASSGVDAVLSQDIPSDILLRSLDLVMLGQQLFPPLPAQPSAEAPPGQVTPGGATLGGATPGVVTLGGVMPVGALQVGTLPAGALPGNRPAMAPFPVLAGRTPPCPPPYPRRGLEREVVLSQREGQVLRWLVDGASNKVIARELQITETTVKAHVKGLLRKVRATNRTQAAIWALENRALEGDVRTLGLPDQPAALAGAGTAGCHASL